MLIKRDFGSRVFYVKPEDEARFDLATLGDLDDRYYKMMDVATVVVSKTGNLLIKGPDNIVDIIDSYYI
jgi:hypothetical protein